MPWMPFFSASWCFSFSKEMLDLELTLEMKLKFELAIDNSEFKRFSLMGSVALVLFPDEHTP